MTKDEQQTMRNKAKELMSGRNYHIEWYTGKRYIPQAVVVPHDGTSPVQFLLKAGRWVG